MFHIQQTIQWGIDNTCDIVRVYVESGKGVRHVETLPPFPLFTILKSQRANQLLV